MGPGGTFSVAGLFAGVGGIEMGLARSGGRAELLCEVWAPARAVLRARFGDVALAGDVVELRSLPRVDVVTAGFPCTDLSQAGLTRGIGGTASGLVGEVFRLLRRPRAPVVVLENVRNMLVLDRGRAMHYLVDELEQLGYRWAYRVVDSRCTGVPQRRQRVILVAARELDPCSVLFADDAAPTPEWAFADRACGFYWTEGVRGLGWARDGVPTLKGGSGIGIPSPPAIWHRQGELGRRLLVPGIEDAEALQGFPRRWTEPAAEVARRSGTRWKLVGNAVTVGVARWVGGRLREPGEQVVERGARLDGRRWPAAACGGTGRAWEVRASTWPVRRRYRHLDDVVDLDRAVPLSTRGTAGFLGRTRRGTLRFTDGFLEDVVRHLTVMDSTLSVA